MTQMKKKKYNVLKATGITGIIVVVFFILLELTGLFVKPELILYDFKMRSRENVIENENIITINIDEGAIATIGRWPWNLNIFAELVDFLKLYDVEMAAFTDIFFDRESEITFNTPTEAIDLKNHLKKLIQETDNLDIIFEYIIDHNQLFYNSIDEYKNVFITNTFFIPDETPSDDEFKELKEFYQNIITEEKKINIEKMNRFIISETPATGLINALDITPPVGALSDITKGVGFNRIFMDIDGKVRRYLLAVNYNGKVYPSLVLAMIADYYECPYDKIKIHLGRYIELTEWNNDKFQTYDSIKIPIDNQGFMLINWTGTYHETFAHYPFNFIAQNYSYFVGKKALSNINIETASMQEIQILLKHTLQESSLLNNENIDNISNELLIAFYMEYLMFNGYIYEQFLEMFGFEDDKGFKSLWNQIFFNNWIVIEYIETNNIPDFQNIINSLSEFGITNLDTETYKHFYDHISFFIKKDKIDRIRPLILPSPVNVLIKNESVTTSLLDLKDKIVFLGLTATALVSFNPNPYTERYIMLGLTPNVFNTIITNNYIRYLSKYYHYLIILLFGFLPVIFVLTLDIKISGILTFLILILYPFSSWYLFINNNLIIDIIVPMLVLLTSFFSGLIYKLIQDRKEQKAIRGMFSTMVSPEVLKILESDPNKFVLAGEKREATLFSSDVSGFTTISEGVTARELADILNVYLTPMSNIIMSYDGYCDKYEGDAIKSSFGVPINDKDHAWKCCYSSLLQQEELKVIQRMILLKYGVEISARMGVNTGLVSAGNMGSEKKMQYTVMGEAVSLAEELEPINKLFESWIAIGPATYKKAGDKIETRLLNYLIMGEGHKLPVYELMGWKKDEFLNYWLGKPIPKLILDGYLKMPPEKILSYYHYYSIKKYSDSTFLQYITDFYNNIKDLCIDYIKTNDIIFVSEVKTGISKLETEIEKEFSSNNLQLNDTLLDEANELMIKSQAAEGWEKIIFEYKSRLKVLFVKQELLESKIDKKISDIFLSDIDILDKRVECINKRIRFPKENDEIGKILSENLIKRLTSNENNIKISEIEKRKNSIENDIQSKKNKFADYLKENSDDYHKLICEYCVFTEKQNELRELFYKAREAYLKRNWDEAISIFKEALKIKPDDGPSIMYIKKIEHYKKNPPAEDWKGEWIGEV